MKKQKRYVLRASSKELNLRFYQSLDENFLFNKAGTLAFINENFADFKAFAEQRGFDFENDEKRYLDVLRAEIYFAEIHQAEVLFALLTALFQPLPHWLYLTTYETDEIRVAVQRWIDKNILRLTNANLKTAREFVQHAVYTGFAPTDSEKAAKWTTNLDNVVWLLDRIGRRYLDAPEYNAYKHGLRVMTGGAGLRIYPDGHPEMAQTVAASPDSFTFLEIRKENGDRVVYETTKLVSPLESYNHLFAMWRMARAIKVTRLARLTNQGGVDFPTFFEVDKERILNLQVFGKWSFTA